jgi:predicted enzyme related to lactoylglutathione lyase
LQAAALALVPLCLAAAACAPEVADKAQAPVKEQAAMTNPVFHFEIPVTDLDRAIAFYEDVFGYQLTREDVDGYDMAFFPRAGDAPGASGALAKGDVYRPSHDGPVIYFDVPDIDAVIARAEARGAKVLYAKKDIGEAGFVAEIEDSEGNRIALSQVKP